MKLILTGGGTAGHAMVNKILIPQLKERGWTIVYIGSENGMERFMFGGQESITYYSIPTGKLRRYLSWKNIPDFFHVCHGIIEAFKIIKKERPQAIFSGGGFVSVPVIIAAWLCSVPSIIRETDFSMGLANRIGVYFAKRLYLTFPNYKLLSKYRNAMWGGMIIGPQLLDRHSKDKAKLVFHNSRPVVLVLGGSQGSHIINQSIWNMLPELLQTYNIIHICGKGKSKVGILYENYIQYEYIVNMGPIYDIADVVMTRSGSNAICEGISLGKRLLCIPMSKKHTRGDQMENADYAIEHACGEILLESELSKDNIMGALARLLEKPLKQDLITSKEELEDRMKEQILGIEEVAKTKLIKEEWKLYEEFI